MQVINMQSLHEMHDKDLSYFTIKLVSCVASHTTNCSTFIIKTAFTKELRLQLCYLYQKVSTAQALLFDNFAFMI